MSIVIAIVLTITKMSWMSILRFRLKTSTGLTPLRSGRKSTQQLIAGLWVRYTCRESWGCTGGNILWGMGWGRKQARLPEKKPELREKAVWASSPGWMENDSWFGIARMAVHCRQLWFGNVVYMVMPLTDLKSARGDREGLETVMFSFESPWQLRAGHRQDPVACVQPQLDIWVLSSVLTSWIWGAIGLLGNSSSAVWDSHQWQPWNLARIRKVVSFISVHGFKIWNNTPFSFWCVWGQVARDRFLCSFNFLESAFMEF